MATTTVKTKDLNPNIITYMNGDDQAAYKKAYLDTMNVQTQANYNTVVANENRSYNRSMANYNTQSEDVKAEYEKAMRSVEQSAYNDSVHSAAAANSQGLTGSMASVAMANQVHTNASSDKAELASDRTTALNNIWTNVNLLMDNHQVNLNELEMNRLAQELSNLSTAELKYIENMTAIDQYNAEITNNWAENERQRQFTANENAKARAAANANTNSNESKNDFDANYYQDYIDYLVTRGVLTDSQGRSMQTYLLDTTYGRMSTDDFLYILNATINGKGNGNGVVKPTDYEAGNSTQQTVRKAQQISTQMQQNAARNVEEQDAKTREIVSNIFKKITNK